MKKKIALFIFILLLVAGIYGLYKYIVFNKNFADSNAVFVKSDSLTFLSFKLPGKIEKIYVNEGDKIKKGQLLAKLETRELELQKKELLSNIKALENKIKAVQIQKNKLQKDISTNIALIKNEQNKLSKNIEAKAYAIDAMRYKLDKLKNDYKKFKRLYAEGKVSKEKFENVKVAYNSLKDTISAEEKKFEALRLNDKTLDLKLKLAENNKKELTRLAQSIKAQQNQLKALNEKLALVEQNIKNSYIYSPIEGRVAKKFANDNEVVDAGMKVLSVVNPKDLYVLDLLEETKMKGIKPGCRVKIHIDALDKDFDGVVSKILPASAATFALVPRDISSGEFTKLAQRFYVRIKFDKVPKGVLVGMGGEVEIKRCND
jgi:membrane fusion protein (multidrug efflux system)